VSTVLHAFLRKQNIQRSRFSAGENGSGHSSEKADWFGYLEAVFSDSAFSSDRAALRRLRIA